MAKVADILSGVMPAKKQKLVTPENASTPMDYVTLFRDAWADSTDVFLTPFSAKQIGELKQAALKLPPELRGKVIDWTVRNWAIFVMVATKEQGAYKLPNLPATNVMSKFVQSMLSAYHQEHQQPAKALHKPVQPIKAPEPIQHTPQEPMADPEALKGLFL